MNGRYTDPENTKSPFSQMSGGKGWNIPQKIKRNKCSNEIQHDNIYRPTRDQQRSIDELQTTQIRFSSTK